MAILVFLAPTSAQGRAGGLDQSFGEDGRVTTEFDVSDEVQLAVAPDGSTVLAHGPILTRYLPDGEPDPAFGEGGRLLLSEDLEGLELQPESIAIDSQGRILVFGRAEDPAQEFEEPLRLLSAPASWAVVLRLSSDGELDPSFGEGKGFIRSDFGVRSEFDTDLPLAGTASGGVDSQDRPIFIADVLGLTGRCWYAHTTIASYPRAVVRLTAAGSPDPTFGGGDGVSPIGGAEGSKLLALDGADQPVAAVGTENCRLGGNRIFRLGADGASLTSFGAAGVRGYPGQYLSLVEPSGALILREGRPTTHLVRLGTEGNPDTSFGADGTAAVRMPSGARRTLRPVALDAQGRILLAGSLSFPKAQKGDRRQQRNQRRRVNRTYIAVTRLLASGELDRGFGKRGWMVTLFSRPKKAFVQQAALDPEGRLLVAAGSLSGTQPPGTRLVLARYLLDG